VPNQPEHMDLDRQGIGRPTPLAPARLCAAKSSAALCFFLHSLLTKPAAIRACGSRLYQGLGRCARRGGPLDGRYVGSACLALAAAVRG